MEFDVAPENRQRGYLREAHQNSSGHQETQRVFVRVTTIDEIVSRRALGHVDFIKMDIEGAETPALRGAKAVLQTSRPRLQIAANHKPEDPVLIPMTVRSITPAYTARLRGCTPTTFRRFQPESVVFE
jgi:hypothetical protein